MYDPDTQAVLWVAIPKELKQRLKVRSFETETPLNRITEQALETYLAALEITSPSRQTVDAWLAWRMD